MSRRRALVTAALVLLTAGTAGTAAPVYAGPAPSERPGDARPVPPPGFGPHPLPLAPLDPAPLGPAPQVPPHPRGRLLPVPPQPQACLLQVRAQRPPTPVPTPVPTPGSTPGPYLGPPLTACAPPLRAPQGRIVPVLPPAPGPLPGR